MDLFELAALYWVAIACEYIFNDIEQQAHCIFTTMTLLGRNNMFIAMRVTSWKS